MWQLITVCAVVLAASCAVVAALALSRAARVATSAPPPYGALAGVNYRQLAANLPHTSVFVVDRDLRFVLAEGEGRLDGADGAGSAAGLVGRLASEALSPAVWEVAGPHYRSALAGRMSEFDAPGRIRGEPVHVRTLPLWGADQEVAGVIVIAERVAEQRQAFAALHAAQAFNEAVLAASPDLMMVLDLESGRWEWSSRSVWAALGWDVDVTTSDDPHAIMRSIAPDDVAAVREAWAAISGLPAGESLTVRFRLLGPDGSQRWISCRATPFERGEGTGGSRALAAVSDVTDLVGVEQRLRHAALHDPLTGLPNRARLVDIITESVERLDPNAEQLALLFCDLDGFKHINDTYGHATGDAVLVEVARRLRGSLRDGDAVARVGGDEFVVLLVTRRYPSETGSESAAETSARVRSLAERIQHQVSRPFECEGNSFEVTLSIGITTADQASTAPDVLGDADAAMYRAKNLGAGRIDVFDRDLQSARESRFRIETTLTDALASVSGAATLSVAYQPIFDVERSRLVAFEALARLTDKNGQPIDPDDFIPVAEDLGLIHRLDRRVMEIALGALADWTEDNPGATPIKMAVNISASQAHRADLASQIGAALLQHGLAPSSLVIEVTETVLVDLRTSTLEQLHKLHDLGVGIAIDDFGTGYASLQYLTTLPVDVIKVDRCFMRGYGTDPTNTAIIRAVAALARELDLVCIFEGIESEEQLDALPRGVLGQGFLLGRPQPGLVATIPGPRDDAG